MLYEPTATVGSSVVNLVKTIVGAGLFAIPYAYKNDGVLVGLLLTSLAAVTSGLGLLILAKCSKTLINPRNSSFFTICMLTYPSLAPLFDLAMVVQCFGVGLSYLVLVGDLFPGLFGGDRNAWIVGSAAIVVPLCSLKKLDSLKYSSIIGMLALFYLSLLIGFRFVKDVVIAPEINFDRGEISWYHVYDLKGLLSTFSIIIFAYVGAMNMFTIVNELKDNSMNNIRIVVNRSLALSSILFVFVGLFGYFTFGSKTMGNILLNYNPEFKSVTVGKFCLGGMLILTFPLLFHPLRTAVNNIVEWSILTFNGIKERESTRSQNEVTNASPIDLIIDDEEIEEAESDPLLGSDIEVEQAHHNTHRGGLNGVDHDISFPETRFYIISFLLLLAMYTLALRVESFALVLALVGSTGSTAISFILPGLFGYKLIGTDVLAVGHVLTTEDRFYRKVSVLLIYFGFAVMILSLYVTLKF
ncbi:Vacuolar amino acid transporter 7 [Nakaseomyces bracarensis]|uniref:Vacuolar amino acid transporter 7 n=1 Tax=Nakaseomyces bracarensis TaxID=273131 RepID=A0ABR4NMU8_9SACH